VRLKSLEIKGFKSFPDKTFLNFDEGITGVIGPNGCGKSNIVDSIRWVIGEQKISQLRSENLESLVFNGSKSRSASGLAEVSLTFENTKNLLPTEFNTVTITRKYYKSGESEYRLNDVSCRLKDIHNRQDCAHAELIVSCLSPKFAIIQTMMFIRTYTENCFKEIIPI